MVYIKLLYLVLMEIQAHLCRLIVIGHVWCGLVNWMKKLKVSENVPSLMLFSQMTMISNVNESGLECEWEFIGVRKR